IAAFDDLDAVQTFAKSCDVLSYEFENIPLATIDHASQFCQVYPDVHALKTSQDRLLEKTFLRDTARIPVVPFFPIESLSALRRAANNLGYPVILKTRRFGYDGKGQIALKDVYDLKSGFARLGGTDLIAEGYAPFRREFSIIAVRGQNGQIKTYPLTENVHKDHRLHTSIAPANDPQNIGKKAHEITTTILEALDYVGVIGVEFFELPGGEILVNEIAPRVHNSGHWTMDAGCTSQFENHIRAICGLPLGDTTPTHKVRMTNLIGNDIQQAQTLASQENTFVHDYHKAEIRPGRKMGHVNRIYPEGNV
ncbi:MAG TPA: 5-(carboxyamino)imidazole ribonucleotide synthase, partial [Hellea balneolensis]|nr:5-(carboxyamino)imidazole ribonucleotide synthase [Hellea balneolensis]